MIILYNERAKGWIFIRWFSIQAQKPTKKTLSLPVAYSGHGVYYYYNNNNNHHHHHRHFYYTSSDRSRNRWRRHADAYIIIIIIIITPPPGRRCLKFMHSSRTIRTTVILRFWHREVGSCRTRSPQQLDSSGLNECRSVLLGVTVAR